MSSESDRNTLRETIQLEREQIREKIRELIESEYAKLEEEAGRIAPEFDYEAEGEKLREEEEEELARVDFAWVEDREKASEEPEEEPDGGEVTGPAEVKAEAEDKTEAGTGTEKEKEKEKEEPVKEKKKEYGPLPKAKVSASKYPKPAYVPKSAAGRLLFGDKHRRTLTAAVVLLAAFAAYQAWDYLVPKTVSIDYMTFSGTETLSYATTARTVGDMMSELQDGGSEGQLAAGADISIGSNDIADRDAAVPVSNGLRVGIRHATKKSAKIAGKKQDLWLVPGTVEENLAMNGVSFDEDDEVKPAPDRTVTEKTSIVVNEVHYDVKEKKETVEAVDKVILDPSLTSGVQETTEGNDGEGIFTYTTKYVNGKNKGTEREVKEWVVEPHDNTLRLGTSATGNSGEYLVTRTFTANTTAYTARSGARGAIGQTVHVGTCAVDPGFVGLRSELWIEGYGYAFANDTGGAVKGNVVDLYMSSKGQCISWGRRNKTAYVITPAE